MDSLEVRAAKNDLCHCGHTRHDHAGLQGHGACRHDGTVCGCGQFCWKGFVSRKVALKIAQERRREGLLK